MITSQEPIIPPIPNVPIADPQTGRCAREWWLWFNQVFQVALAQQGQIDVSTIFPFVPPDVPPIPVDLLSAIIGQQGVADQPGDPTLSGVVVQVPPDGVSADQIVMRALSLGMPA
jgi:hypothetical protein